jgi:hypothetical protein
MDLCDNENCLSEGPSGDVEASAVSHNGVSDGKCGLGRSFHYENMQTVTQ